MSLVKRVIHDIRKNKLWHREARVLVAVSGGLDSISLMHLLARTRGAHGAQLEVASVDHGLRKESKDEVEFVKSQAEALGLPFSAHVLSISAGGNLQERARKARHAALLSHGTARIATGHHANDQAETVLYRLLRGSGLDGLRGMTPLRIPWCRPLLGIKRAALLAWAKEEGLVWIEDPSNVSSLRGRMRPLFAQLDAFHGDSVNALARSAELLAQDAAFLEEHTHSCWLACFDGKGLQRDSFEAYPLAIQLRLLRRLCQKEGVPIRARLLQQVLRTGASADFPGGARLCYGSSICFLDTQ